MAQSRRFPTPNSLIASSALVVALALTGCQANGAEAPTAASQTSDSASSPSSSPSKSGTPTPTTPEPTPASSDGPAAHIPVPEKPALADKNTKAGLEAFTEWWFELFSYGYVTNNWKPFDSVTDRGCKSCENIKSIVQGVYKKGRWLKGGDIRVLEFATKFELNTAGSILSYVKDGQDPITYFEADGTRLGTDPASDPVFNVVIAVYDEGEWIMLDYGKPEGT